MSFAPGPSMSSQRDGCAAVPVDAQHVLIIGGRDTSESALATTELLDVAALEFSPGPTMQTGRNRMAAVRLGAAEEQRILVIGGKAPRTRGGDSDDDPDDEDDSIYLSATEGRAAGAPPAVTADRPWPHAELDEQALHLSTTSRRIASSSPQEDRGLSCIRHGGDGAPRSRRYRRRRGARPRSRTLPTDPHRLRLAPLI